MNQLPSIDCIVLAAGRGVRMKSSRPKVLHRVCGRSLLEYVLRAASSLRPKRIIVVVGFEAEMVKKELEILGKEDFLHGIEMLSVTQSEQKGTGHAAQIALGQVRAEAKSVLIFPGDVPFLSKSALSEMLNKQASGSEVVFLSSEPPLPYGYGRVCRDTKGQVTGIVEQRDLGPEEKSIPEVNVSVYAADRAFLARALSTLQPNNAQGEYYLTDIVSFGAQQGLSVQAVKLSDYREALGANSQGELAQLEALRRMELNEGFMNLGVRFEDPLRAYVDEGVQLAADTFIGSGTRLRGKTTLSRGVVVDGDSIIVDSSIGEDCRVKLGCFLDGAHLGQSCQVGPFAHLRPGTKLGDNVRIGNFVETKKVEMKDGVKANHLSYIGDAFVEEDVNIGAGTITCNYDGIEKHQTTIRRGAFIGSNTSLVAPVTIGEGAVIGAGSAITKDVPAQALGLERSDQLTIAGWSEKRRVRQNKASQVSKQQKKEK